MNVRRGVDLGTDALAKDVGAALVARYYEGAPTLLAVTFARVLSAKLLLALADRAERPNVVPWLERMYADVPIEPRLAHMFLGACKTVRKAVRVDREIDRTLAFLERQIGDLVVRRAPDTRREAIPYNDEVDATIAAFLVRLDDADPLSAEHSRAVSLWCRRVATRLNLDGATARFAGRCGLLHDVGKAYTPSDILHAPRSLTDAEWAIMRDHPVAGAMMVSQVEALRPFEPAVRWHHERLDGKGYPDRLEAREISLVVRIVTVADSFNAMIGRRPYRLPLSPANAIEQLVRHSGQQFDPLVVEAMTDVVENPISAAERRATDITLVRASA